MGVCTRSDEIEAFEEIACVMVGALFALEARLGRGAAAIAAHDAAESLMGVLDALAAIQWPEQEQDAIFIRVH